MESKTREKSRQAGRLIRSLRVNKGVTQSELGDRLGVKKQSISAVERNRRRLTIDHYDLILGAMGYQLQIVPLKQSDPGTNSEYPVRSLFDVALRTRDSDEDQTFRTSLRECYRYVAHERDPVAILREPVSTGDPPRDAYLAGVAEGIARFYGWDVPAWTQLDRYTLSEPYFPGAPEGMKVALWQMSPSYFRVRNIFVDDTAVVGPLEKYGAESETGARARG